MNCSYEKERARRNGGGDCAPSFKLTNFVGCFEPRGSIRKLSWYRKLEMSVSVMPLKGSKVSKNFYKAREIENSN